MFTYNFTSGFLIMSINHACVNKPMFLLKSRLLLIIYFAYFYQNCSKSCLAVLILPSVPAGVADHKEITAIHFSVNA